MIFIIIFLIVIITFFISLILTYFSTKIKKTFFDNNGVNANDRLSLLRKYVIFENSVIIEKSQNLRLQRKISFMIEKKVILPNIIA